MQMKLFKIVAGVLIGGFAFSSFAEDNPLKGLSKETQAACAREFASGKLNPLRAKLPMGWWEKATDGMRRNEAKPSPSERNAINAYIDAELACGRYLRIDWFPTDQQARREAEGAAKKNLADRFDPLRTGKITYAEYFRREDKRAEELLATIDSQRRAHQFERRTYDWMSPFAAKWPEKSPWWDFYKFAIATAKDVDSGKITETDGLQMIEDKRLKTNVEIAAADAPKTLTLNCSLGAENGRSMQQAVQIDYARKLVNGSSAQFFENEITWSYVGGGDTTFNLRLNRLSGFLVLGSAEFPALFSGHCSQANRQF